MSGEFGADPDVYTPLRSVKAEFEAAEAAHDKATNAAELAHGTPAADDAYAAVWAAELRLEAAEDAAGEGGADRPVSARIQTITAGLGSIKARDPVLVIEGVGTLRGGVLLSRDDIEAAAHREVTATSLRVLGYSYAAIAEVLAEADALLARSRAEAVSLPTMPLAAREALNRVVGGMIERRHAEPVPLPALPDPAHILATYAEHKALNDAHAMQLPGPNVAADKKHRADRKRRKKAADKSKRRNRR